MKFQFLSFLLFIISLFILATSFYMLKKWFDSYSMLKEARKTSVIIMQKNQEIQSQTTIYEAVVNMNPAKWKYHRGLPLIILDPQEKPLSDILSSKEIIFELKPDSGKTKKIILSFKDIKKCQNYLQKKLKISKYSGSLSPVSYVVYPPEFINYEKDLNTISLIFSPSLTEKGINNLQILLFFQEGDETAIPSLYLIGSIVLGLLGMGIALITSIVIKQRKNKK